MKEQLQKMLYIFDEEGYFVGAYDRENVCEFSELPQAIQDEFAKVWE